MRFEALTDLLDDCLEFPIGDTIFRVALPDAETGLRLSRMFADISAKIKPGDDATAADLEIMDDAQELLEFQHLLGSTWDEMAEDDVPYAVIRLVAMTVMWHTVAGPEIATEFWLNRGVPGKAPARPQDRKRAGAHRDTTRKAAAATTRKRVSTNGTRSAPLEEEVSLSETSSPTG